MRKYVGKRTIQIVDTALASWAGVLIYRLILSKLIANSWVNLLFALMRFNAGVQ